MQEFTHYDDLRESGRIRSSGIRPGLIIRFRQDRKFGKIGGPRWPQLNFQDPILITDILYGRIDAMYSFKMLQGDSIYTWRLSHMYFPVSFYDCFEVMKNPNDK